MKRIIIFLGLCVVCILIIGIVNIMSVGVRAQSRETKHNAQLPQNELKIITEEEADEHFIEAASLAQEGNIKEARGYYNDLIYSNYYVLTSHILLDTLDEYEHGLIDKDSFDELLNVIKSSDDVEVYDRLEEIGKKNEQAASVSNLLSFWALTDENMAFGKKYANDAISINPQSPNGYICLALTDLGAAQIDEARSSLEKAIDLDPHRIDTYIYLVSTYFFENRYIKAKNILREAEDFNNEYLSPSQKADFNTIYADIIDSAVAFYFNKGLEAGAAGKFEDAKKDFEMVLEFDEYDIDSISSIVMLEDLEEGVVSEEYAKNIYKSLMQWDNSKDDMMYLEKAIEINPKYPRAYSILGVKYKQDGDYDKAIEYYKKAIQLDDKYYIAYYNMGLAYDDQEKYDQALENYNKCVEIYPEFASAYRNMGIIYKKLGDYEKAIDYHKKAIKIRPYYCKNYYSISLCLFLEDKYEQALDEVLLALQYCPSYHRAYQQLGACYKALGRNGEAIEAFRTAIRLDPQEEYPYRKLGQIYYKLGFYENSIKRFEQAVERTEDNYLNYMYLGYNYQELKKYEKAISFFGAALEKRPKSAKANYYIGHIYHFYLDKPAQAIPYLKEATKSDNAYASAHLDLGCAYFELENFPQAKKHLEKAKKTIPREG